MPRRRARESGLEGLLRWDVEREDPGDLVRSPCLGLLQVAKARGDSEVLHGVPGFRKADSISALW